MAGTFCKVSGLLLPPHNLAFVNFYVHYILPVAIKLVLT